MSAPARLALASLLLAGHAAGCSTSGGGEPARGATATPGASITGPEARALVAGGATLVDVRSAEEWGDGHLGGAVHIPVGELAARMGELPKDRPVVVYCQSGGRSRKAAAQLAAAGYQVRDLGGMDAW